MARLGQVKFLFFYASGAGGGGGILFFDLPLVSDNYLSYWCVQREGRASFLFTGAVINTLWLHSNLYECVYMHIYMY